MMKIAKNLSEQLQLTEGHAPVELPKQPGPVWVEGWLSTARPVRSPNFGLRPLNSCIQLAVIHSISLPPGQYGGQAIEQLFTNQLDWSADPYFAEIKGLEVSAHFLIKRQGELTQFVSVDKRAWHAGQSVWHGRANCNDYSVGIELEGLEDHPFEAQQYRQLAALLRHLASQYPIEQIVGHEHIAPGRKRDPGQAFNWPHLADLLQWPPQYFPPACDSTMAREKS